MASLPVLLGAINQAASTKHLLYRSVMFHTDVPENADDATQAMLRSLDSTILCIVVSIESEIDHYCTTSSKFDLMVSVHRLALARDALTKCPKPDVLDMRIEQALFKMVKLMEKKWKMDAAEEAKRAHGLF